LIRDTCNICGKEFAVDFEVSGDGRTFPLPGNIPLRVRHHQGGNHVDVPGTLTGFYEIVDGKLVEVEPVVSDVLEG
jgi:hypothetical protein